MFEESARPVILLYEKHNSSRCKCEKWQDFRIQDEDMKQFLIVAQQQDQHDRRLGNANEDEQLTGRQTKGCL